MAGLKGKPKGAKAGVKKMDSKQPLSRVPRGAALKKGAGMAPMKPARGY